ncbi:MAG: TolC family protein [Firmicutes bacterium]|nr:TolC family protein [Bacillota bacterium]
MKKIFTYVFVLVLTLSLITTSYAQDNEKVIESSNESKDLKEAEIKFNLEKAIHYALENNDSMEIQELNIKKTEVSYDKNISDVDDFEDAPSYIQNQTPVVQRKMFKLGIMEKSADLSLNIAKWNKDIKINEIKYNVEKAYYDLAQAKKGVEIAKESVELAKEQFEQGKKMYELGTISNQQLLNIELGLARAQSGLDSAKMGLEMQEMNFNNTLGLDLDKKINLTDNVSYKEHEEIDLQEAITKALESNKSLEVTKTNHEISKLTLEAIKARYPKNTYKYREQEIEVKKAAKSVETAEKGIEMGVRSAYLQLTTAEKQIATYEKSVEKSERAYELAKLSFELGKSTTTEVNQARIDLMNAKKDLSSQIHSYNMALLDFRYSQGIGKTQIGGI